MRRRPLIAIAVALAAIGLAAAATAAAKRPRRCNGEHSLCSRHLNHAVLPATHNSMSAASLGWKIPNQPVGIGAQLRDGIRGLLIDTHYGRLQPDGTVVTDDDHTHTAGRLGLYLCHEACEIGASPLVPQLRSIRLWLERFPNNVLMIDVEDYIAQHDFAGAMRRSGLLHYAYRGAFGPRWPTLGRMISRHRQVVVLAEHDAGAGAYPWYHLDYHGIVQETPYTFDQPGLLTDPANWAASCVPNRGGRVGSLFLMNHWSPPTPTIAPDHAEAAAVNAKRVIVGRARECARVRDRLPTIIAVDHYRDGDLFGAVRRLNALAAP